MWQAALCSRFSTARASSAASASRIALSASGAISNATVQLAASGLSQNSAASLRSSGPAWVGWQRSGCAPYCSLLVRFRSSIKARSFSLWVRMPHAFCRAAAGRAVSCSSCSAQPRISASGVRTSWLTPAIQLVRASSRRAMISLRRRSCSLVRLTVSASSPAKPSVGSRIVPPSATVASPAAIVCKRRAPRQLNSRQHAAGTPSSSASAGSIPAAMAFISCALL